MTNKTSKKILSVTVAAAIVASLASVENYAVYAKKKASVSSKTITLHMGKKKKIRIRNKKKRARYTYKSSAKKVAKVSAKGVIIALRPGTAKITVKESYNVSGKKKTRTVGKFKVKVKNVKNNPAVSNAPGKSDHTITPSPAPSSAATPTATPGTPSPAPSSTPVAYTGELFSIKVSKTKLETVDGSTCRVEMQYFDGNVSGKFFNGTVYKNSSNVRKIYKDGRTTSCARYMIKGKDDTGKDCKIFIQDDGVEKDGVTVTKPLILTNSSSLSWIEKADIQGTVETDTNGDTVVTYICNGSNEEKFLPPEPVRPDMSKDYTKELFTFYINIGTSDSVAGKNGNATMIHFTGRGECDNFNGTIVSDSVDTRLKFPGIVESLSARYILDGTDASGNPCRIYVENNGIDDNGMVTEPVIITDSPDYAWIETAPLHGTVSWEKGLTIHMWTVEA